MKPLDEGYFGECRIIYGPIKLSPTVWNRVNSILEKRNESFKVKGKLAKTHEVISLIEIDDRTIKVVNDDYQILA